MCTALTNFYRFNALLNLKGVCRRFNCPGATRPLESDDLYHWNDSNQTNDMIMTQCKVFKTFLSVDKTQACDNIKVQSCYWQVLSQTRSSCFLIFGWHTEMKAAVQVELIFFSWPTYFVSMYAVYLWNKSTCYMAKFFYLSVNLLSVKYKDFTGNNRLSQKSFVLFIQYLSRLRRSLGRFAT